MHLYRYGHAGCERDAGMAYVFLMRTSIEIAHNDVRHVSVKVGDSRP